MHRSLTAIICILLVLILIDTGNSQLPRGQSPIQPNIDASVNRSAVPVTDSLIQSIIDQTNLDTLILTINILSGEDSVTIKDSTYLLLSRNAEHPHNNLAADFIFQTLNRFGLPTYNQNYSETGRNVYAVQTGTDYPEQIFIICAHYDDRPDEPAPGADDNASGTAVVLEAARILSQIPTPSTIIYALWDEEEIGLIGSTYFAQQAFQSRENILGVINLDMLGWDENDDGLFDIHTRPIDNSVELANLTVFLHNYYNIGLTPIIYNEGTYSSDHASFWHQEYSAIFLIEAFRGGDFNPFYHTSDDRIVHFNLNYFHALSKLAVATISYLSFNNISVKLENITNAIVSGFILEQNYPNPFNPTTTIEFFLPRADVVTLKIFNILGEEIETLISKKLPAGKHKYQWDASRIPSGVYLYRLSVKSITGRDDLFIETRKMIFTR